MDFDRHVYTDPTTLVMLPCEKIEEIWCYFIPALRFILLISLNRILVVLNGLKLKALIILPIKNITFLKNLAVTVAVADSRFIQLSAVFAYRVDIIANLLLIVVLAVAR